MRYFLVVCTKTGRQDGPAIVDLTNEENDNHLYYATEMMAGYVLPDTDSEVPLTAFSFESSTLDWEEEQMVRRVWADVSAARVIKRLSSDGRFDREEGFASLINDDGEGIQDDYADGWLEWFAEI